LRKFILLMITVLLLIAAVPAAAFAQETPVTAGTATPGGRGASRGHDVGGLGGDAGVVYAGRLRDA
jgi:hypothetical protein